jgi:hypothetical protein
MPVRAKRRPNPRTARAPGTPSRSALPCRRSFTPLLRSARAGASARRPRRAVAHRGFRRLNSPGDHPAASRPARTPPARVDRIPDNAERNAPPMPEAKPGRCRRPSPADVGGQAPPTQEVKPSRRRRPRAAPRPRGRSWPRRLPGPIFEIRLDYGIGAWEVALALQGSPRAGLPAFRGGALTTAGGPAILTAPQAFQAGRPAACPFSSGRRIRRAASEGKPLLRLGLSSASGSPMPPSRMRPGNSRPRPAHFPAAGKA